MKVYVVVEDSFDPSGDEYVRRVRGVFGENALPTARIRCERLSGDGHIETWEVDGDLVETTEIA